VDYAIRHAQESLRGHDWAKNVKGVVIPDVRFSNELAAIRKAGGEVWRIIRPGAGLSGEAAHHASEHGIEDGDCDRIILNDGTLGDLRYTVLSIQPGDTYCGAV
jgi:hypothetical protein